MIGCGRAAQSWHLPALAAEERARIAAVAETDAARLTEVADRFAVARRSADYGELLEDPAVDAVAVCVPVGSHAEVVQDALDAEKHVLVEKPLALSLDECDRIVDRAARSSRKVAVGFNLRSHRLLQRARDIVRSGRLGEVKLVRSAFTSPSRHRIGDPPWRASRERGGGVLIEQAIHHLDLWRFLLDDEIESIDARSFGWDETATVAARTRSGVPISGEFSDATAPVNELDVYGTDARLRVSCYRFDGLEVLPAAEAAGDLGRRLRRAPALARELREALPAIRTGGDWAASYRAEWRSFIGAIESGAEVPCTVEDGRRAVQALLAALSSTALEGAVEVASAPREATPLTPA